MISNRDLVSLVTIISWLDKARWEQDDSNWLTNNAIFQNLRPEQKILTHWLCYITDLQMPARIVWDKGGIVFSNLVKDYDITRFDYGNVGKSVTDFIKAHQESSSNDEKKVPHFLSLYEGKPVSYAPRFPFQNEQIIRTLQLLLDYDKSLMNFIAKYKEQYNNDKEGLVRIAHALDLLTYRTKINLEKTRGILQSRNLMDENYASWKLNRTEGHKRLWAALRDYLKSNTLRSYIKEYLIWPYNNFELSQLELPGDLWNERFAEYLIYRVAERSGINVRKRKNNISSPSLARKIHENVKENESEFYPEQLDVSWDFTPRMCDKHLCKICPFGKGNPLMLCTENQNKFCPVLLTTCGYISNCKPSGCPVRDKIGYGLCTVS
jgi:hypothetical protein